MKITADLKARVFVALLTTLLASCGESNKATTDSGTDAKADVKVDATVDTQTDTKADVSADVAPIDVPAEVAPPVDAPAEVAPPADAPAEVAPPADAPAEVAPPADAPTEVAPPADGPVEVAPPTYTIGGTITGLTGTGLVLRDNGGDNLTVAANATTFTFATRIAGGGAYAVTVQTQPGTPTQTCTVTAGTGTVAAANVTNVAIACVTQSFTVGGTIAGLTATSTALVLRDTVGGSTIVNLTVTPGATTSFVFGAQASGSTYAVTVPTQPSTPTQICTVANGTGTVGAANVTNVTITCATQAFTVGGTISGLTTAGLVLRNNGGDNLTVAANATTFTFATSVASGAAYLVTILTQPTTQVCTITTGTGTGTVGGANVASVAITCVTPHTVGGTVTGLVGTGLTLQNNGGNTTTVAPNGGAPVSFTFSTALVPGAAYTVTFTGQPSSPTQSCVFNPISSATGTVGGSNVTNVAITCTTTSFVVSGTVTNLLGTGLRVRNNADAATDITVTPGTPTFAFAAQLSGSAYAVTFAAQPTSPTQTCAVTAGVAAGTVGSANVALTVTCTTSSFTVGGSVTGLSGAGLRVRNNNTAATEITVTTGTPTFTFPAQLSGSAYSVSVSVQPTGQTCTPTPPPPISGTVGGANVTGIIISCVANSTPVCDSVQESGDPGNPSTLTLTCPAGKVMTVDFAMFGAPSGACPSGPFVANPDVDGGVGPCAEPATTSRSIVNTACNTMSTCTLTVATPGFGGGPFTDPCNGVQKTLTVHATCQ